jgi:hypothetical protein
VVIGRLNLQIVEVMPFGEMEPDALLVTLVGNGTLLPAVTVQVASVGEWNL